MSGFAGRLKRIAIALRITIALNLLGVLLTISPQATASGVTLLKYGAWFEGCLETCTAGPDGGTLQQCRSFCGCMVDDINRRGVAAEYFPFARQSPDFAERTLQMQKSCAAKVLAGADRPQGKPKDSPITRPSPSADRGKSGRQNGSPRPPSEERLVEPTLQGQEIKKWWAYSWGQPNPGGRFEATLGDAQILLCHYHSPSNHSPITRIAWHDPPPASPRDLIRLNGRHPIGQLGGLRLDRCPRRIGDFDEAKKQAG